VDHLKVEILAGILLICALLAGWLFMSDYFTHTSTAEELTSQIQVQNNSLALLSEKTRASIAEMVNNPTGIDELLSSIDRESKVIPSETIDSNDILRAILNHGQKNMVNVIPLSTQDWSKGTYKGNDYQVFKIALQVSGAQDNVIQFIRRLPDLYKTLVIGNISLKNIIETSIAGAKAAPLATSSVAQISANLNLSLYTR
jgi:hypothetical protein